MNEKKTNNTEHAIFGNVEPPHGLRDVPRFLKEMISGFFIRMAYIFSLVFKTGKWIFFAMLGMALFNGVTPFISLWLSKELLNKLQFDFSVGNTSLAAFLGSTLFLILIFYFVLTILSSIVGIVNNAVTRIAGELIVKEVKLRIMNKTKELDLSSFDTPDFYEKLENANREAGNRPVQVLSSTLHVISLFISLILYIIAIISIPGMWWAALVKIVVTIPTAFINFTYRRKNFAYIRRRSKERREMEYYSDTTVDKNVAKEIRLFHLSDFFMQKYENSFNKYYVGLRKLILKENLLHILTVVLSAVVNCVFFAILAFRVTNGEFMIGDYSYYTGSLLQISNCVTSLIAVSASVYEGSLFIDNLMSFMKEKKTIVPLLDDKNTAPLKVKRGVSHTIELCHVSFSYPGCERKVIDDVSLTIREGETLVLVGLNGAGKTTLIKLITRLYDPTEGVILLDGEDIRHYEVDDLYKVFGIIFQDFGKYAVTVSDNIRFGDIYKPENKEDIVKASELSDASEFIDKLPDGIDTPLTRVFEQNGIELSGGQWQKLAISRAFYGESDILILDEPTASLDPMAEHEVFSQFDALRKDKTTIFVSHRLSNATIATKIAVLEYGKLIEEGDHRTLMEKKGRYYELFTTQAKRYIEQDKDVSADGINK